MKIDANTSMPIGWVIALLVGCASFTTVALKVGQYVGGRDAEGAEVVNRITKLERRTDNVEALSQKIDRRLFRMELNEHIQVPVEDRIPGVKK